MACGHARATNEKMSLFSQIGRLILDPAIPDEQLRQRIFEEVSSRDRFAVAVEDSQRLLRPLDDTHFDLIEHRYGHIRQFAPAVLEALEFRSLSLVAPLHEAVELLQTLNRERRRRVPDDASLGFVPSKWRPHLVDEQGRIDRHLYELCVLFQLRDALRSGDIWLEGSRRFANPATYLISADRWPVLRGEVCRILTLTEHGPRRLATIAESIDNLVDGLENHLENSETVRLQDDRVVISPHAAEQLPEEIVSLSVQVTQRLPRIELADLLIEVDRWTGFTKHFTHAGGAKPRNPDLTRHLYATILAQACNFGLTTMAEVSDLSYRQLAWTTDWYLREETLKAAFSALVDYQHRLPLAQAWGGGALSSSDGQRFPVRGRAENATALPRYFGLEGALVTLDGSGSSDPDDDPLKYRWNQYRGERVVLSSRDVVNPTFTAPRELTVDVVLSFRLLVTDPGGRFDTDTVEVTVTVTDEDNENPGKPLAPTVSAATPYSLMVEWMEPENTGPAITDYDVQYREDGSGDGFTDAQHQGTALTATLTGLMPDTVYEVQVRATNATGTGDWSESGEGKTKILQTGDQIYYFPHLAVGASWQTTITYINYSREEVTCQTDFLSDHGTPVMVSFAGLGMVDSRTDVLLPGGSVHQETNVDLSAPLAPGWALVNCSGPVKASLLYRQHNSEGVPTAEAGVNATAVPATRRSISKPIPYSPPYLRGNWMLPRRDRLPITSLILPWERVGKPRSPISITPRTR